MPPIEPPPHEPTPVELVFWHEQARRADRCAAILRIEADRLRQADQDGACERIAAALERLLTSEAAPADARTWRMGQGWVLAAPCAGARDADQIARELVAAARRLRVEDGAGSARHATLSVGVAHDGHRSQPCIETLLLVAGEGLRVAAAAGGNRWVHTELYAHFQGAVLERASAAVASGRLEDIELVPQRRAAPAEPRREEQPAPEPATAADPLDVLERRIAKLNRALEEAEAEIARLRGARGEGGLPSIYRDVQGLDAEAPFGDLKNELMRQIFEANQALQQQLQAAG